MERIHPSVTHRDNKELYGGFKKETVKRESADEELPTQFDCCVTVMQRPADATGNEQPSRSIETKASPV